MAAEWIELSLLAVVVAYLLGRWLAYQRDTTGQFLRNERSDVVDFSIYLYSSKRQQCAHLDE
ncbi:hypothetical protein HQ393_16695 [Chitinibacter bivalviorum]|uniref:Uncharacterized protein n=1 Tax=Chitinibacter bivalviorum TaxID=2739434 RepID=A0A7H9BM25_9NEIS|nr:hypothetical protein [Chitinibacter bivalviorum]QLG89750.1 hypothetical protein HQ393_16695 [Chitinibacter bivalviorum]